MIAHEPPLVSLLAGDPGFLPLLQEFQTKVGAVVGYLKRGEIEEGAKRFVDEVAFGPGAWELFPEEARRIFIDNALTFVDEVEDPACADIDLQALAGYRGPALLTRGDQSMPWFPRIAEKLAEALPQAQPHTYEGAGHLPQWTQPNDFVASLIKFLSPPPRRPLTGTATMGSARRDLGTGATTVDFTAHLSHLGAVTGHDVLTIKVTGSTTFSYTGTTTFVAANGDELFATVTGSGTFTTTTAETMHTGTITGGTGRFTGASGTYTDTASFVLVSVSGPIQISRLLTAAFKGEISY